MPEEKISQLLSESAKFVREEVGPLKEEIKKIKDDVDKIKGIIEIDFWKDRRFWAGIVAIPALIFSGWVVKLVLDNAELLRLIHRGFGTEPALVATLNENKENDLKLAIKSAVGSNLGLIHVQLAMKGHIKIRI